MAVSYNKLWKLLIDKGMTKTELRLQTDMSTATLAKMSKNEVVSMDVMLRICKVLDCNVGDIMDATKENYLERELRVLLGEHYRSLNVLKQIEGGNYLQARMPYDPNVR